MGATERIHADTPMTVAGATILRRHFEELLSHEAGARKGEDPEEIHRMRVASRRMRASLRLFKGYLSPKLRRQVNERLRNLARLLGDVRDIDVYKAGLSDYQADMPPGPGDGLDGLFASCSDAWTQAHLRLIDYLERRGYVRLQKSSQHLIVSAETTATGTRVGDAAPELVWDRYQTLIRRGDDVLEHADPAALHPVRIAAKRLRYSIESFDDVFGPGTGPVLAEVRLAQDHLGGLNDALVAIRFTACYLASGSVSGETPGSVGVLAPLVGDYLVHVQRLAGHSAHTSSSMWERLGNPSLGADLSVAIGRR